MYELVESDSWMVCIVFVAIVFFGGIVLVNLFLAAIFQVAMLRPCDAPSHHKSCCAATVARGPTHRPDVLGPHSDPAMPIALISRS